MNGWMGPLLVASIALAAGCAMNSDSDGDTLSGDRPSEPMGLKVQGALNVPAPDPSRRAQCLDIILADNRLGCIFQGLGVGGAQSLEDQQNAAIGCNCTAEIVTTEVPDVVPGTRRVAIHCPGDPEFFGIFSPPPPDGPEVPFIGIHLNPFPDDLEPKMCDVTLGGDGPRPSDTIDDCSKSECHGRRLNAKWFPSAVPANLGPAYE